jgi:hypothetical protein
MVPKRGDFVIITKEFMNYDIKYKGFENKKLEVIKVSLGVITNNGPEYVVYFVGEGYLQRIMIDKNGCKEGFPVFELWDTGEYNPSRSEPSEDDICKNCGAMGEVKGMACVCPSCGSLIWGI